MSKTDPDIETRMKVFHRDHGRCFIENGWLVSAYNDHPEEVPVFSEYRNRELILNN